MAVALCKKKKFGHALSRCCEENHLCLLRESNTRLSGRPFCSQVTIYCLNCPDSSTNKRGYWQAAHVLDYCQTEHNGLCTVTCKLVGLNTSVRNVTQFTALTASALLFAFVVFWSVLTYVTSYIPLRHTHSEIMA
jgi:hypothetical protein